MQITSIVNRRVWCGLIAMATVMGLIGSPLLAQPESAIGVPQPSDELPQEATLRASVGVESLTTPSTVEAEIDAADFPVSPTSANNDSSHVLMIIGLPGTPSHAVLHQRLGKTWYVWFQKTLGVPAGNILVCNRAAAESTSKLPLYSNDRAGIQEAIRQLAERADPQGTTWIMMLGHGSYDGRDAYLHLPGPDLSARDYAALFADLPGGKQLVCCTMSCSGHFLEHLARPGRIVMTATTADAEPNETEFPEALAVVMRRSAGTDAVEYDQNGDQYLSLLELFAATGREVVKRYAADSRAETEHALLDDDGDGRGSEMDAWAKFLTPTSTTDGDDVVPIESSGSGEPIIAQATEPASDGAVAAQWRLLRIAGPAPVTNSAPTVDEIDPSASRDGS